MKPSVSRQRVFSAAAFLAIASATVLSVFPPAAHAAPNDTGQTQCYNAAGIGVPCNDANTGDTRSLPRQDGRFGRDAQAAAGALGKTGGGDAGFDLSKICNNGSDCSASVAIGVNPADWGCTRDNATGLMWEVKTAAGSGNSRDASWTYTWYDSTAPVGARGVIGDTLTCGNTLGGANCNTENYVAAINATGLCGHSDWRLPTPRELLSIVHRGRVGPAIDPVYFPNTTTDRHWSSTTTAADADLAWNVGFNDGDVGLDDKINFVSVRLVRGGL